MGSLGKLYLCGKKTQDGIRQDVISLHCLAFLLATVAMTKTKPRNCWKGILAGMKEEHHKEVIHVFSGLGFVARNICLLDCMGKHFDWM